MQTNVRTGKTDTNPLRYRGYYYDAESGFYYLQSRYYDPEIGRFINADTFVSTGQGFIGYNMFAYCGNNPVTFLDPSGQVIILPDYTTEEQRREYERAIAYLKQSETGKKLIERLETSPVKFYIVFTYEYAGYRNADNIIFFPIYVGMLLEDGTQSAALGLAHEMGHAAQDLDGIYAIEYFDEARRELYNLKVYETPIALELGEPIRDSYEDAIGLTRMENSTHFQTVGERPWWHYLFPWNWGKPKEITIDHNL